ncbi:protein translocase subunit SecF [Carnimonas nigrificans]|uniref:protein translocase subunit SecF n=1 Tax=Carnimonas nigrificans TaxID=64323 RepID=UPI00046FD009|nr:protein translocase subunit SecF [Carnimonas nigrificans]
MKLINFMGMRRIAYVISIVLAVISIGSLAYKHLNLGLDFTGGTQVEIHYDTAPNVDSVRQTLDDAGYQNVSVQTFGDQSELLVRLQNNFTNNLGDTIVQQLSEHGENPRLVRSDFVGAQVGDQLRDQGGLGLLVAVIGIVIYLAIRFQFKFAIGAVVALLHDVLIVLGIFSLFGLEFNLTVMAAILAVLGYSLNDTIVVYDRIRENIQKSRSNDVIRLCNDAINQTLARTIATSGTTVIVLVALLLMGGDMLHNFSIALLLGIVLGTFSSIYVAAALLVLLNLKRSDLISGRHQALDDGMP